MEFRDEMRRAYYYIVQIGNIGLQLLWHILHFMVSVFNFVLGIAHVIESHLISSGLLKKYKAFSTDKVQYLAIVIESEEADQTSRVIKLLLWLKAIGVKYICLYDVEGVMKKSRKAILEKLNNVTIFEEAGENNKLVSQNCMTLEFASFSDGKEAVAKAANLLLKNYMKLAYMDGDQEEQIFTEAQMIEALKATGFNGPEPDLILVYGPARCHLGFPAWRIRYSEIVHMGPLTSMRYGSLVKAIYKFTMVRQNFGK